MARPKRDEVKTLARAILALTPERRAELTRTIALVEELGQPVRSPTRVIEPKQSRSAAKKPAEVPSV